MADAAAVAAPAAASTAAPAAVVAAAAGTSSGGGSGGDSVVGGGAGGEDGHREGHDHHHHNHHHHHHHHRHHHDPALCVAVGSTNRVKTGAVASAFKAAVLPVPEGGGWEVTGWEVASGVPAQPMGDDDTLRGARNRAAAAAEAYRAANGAPPLFAVGLEGGCAVQPASLGSSSGGSGGGGDDAAAVTVECFAWMAVLHVASGRWGVARTASFALPPAVATLVLEGVELGVADDRVFGRVNSKAADGAVGLLTRGAIDRAAYYTHALLLALAPFVSASHYFGAEWRML